MKIFKKIGIGIVILILLILGAVFLVINTFSKENSHPSNFPLDKGEQGILSEKAILEIDSQKYEANIVAGETAYDFMAKLEQEGKISFKEKNYIGMGELITEINGLDNNGSESWIYYVNGKEASAGVSNYKLVNEDIISWNYEKNIY
jgi:hypothetical protein